MCVHSFKDSHAPPIVWIIKCTIVNRIYTCSLNSFEDVNQQRMFLYAYLTQHRSNIGAFLRKATEQHPPTHLRAVSHYGHPSREAMGLNGQTLLREKRNGLKVANNIHELEPSASHNVQPPKAKPKVQSSKEEGASHFIPCPKQPLQSTSRNLVNFFFVYEKN